MVCGTAKGKGQMMRDRLLKESDVLRAVDNRIKELSLDPQFIQKHGIIDVMGVKKHILAIPSADRPQGEWIAVASYSAFGGSEEQWYAHGNPTAYHYCSVCKEQVHLDEFGEEMLTNFCPHCGARMKGADDD